MQLVRNYRYLHKPFRLVWFESDELMILFMGFVLALTVSLFFFLFAAVALFFIRRIKDKFPRGFIRHISYFLGIYRFKNAPTFFENTFNE